MSSPDQLEVAKLAPTLHPYETFDPAGDYAEFEARVLRPAISRSYAQQYYRSAKLPDIPLPVAVAPNRPSIEAVHQLILETDYNRPSRDITFPNYPAPKPKQSAALPIIRRVYVSGFSSLKSPEYFIVTNNGGFRVGDIVVLGGRGPREAVVEGVEEIGRYFVLYAVREVGSAPMNSPLTTHLVTPLSFYRPFPIRFLYSVLTCCFPCMFRNSSVFEEDVEQEDVEQESIAMTEVSSIISWHSGDSGSSSGNTLPGLWKL